MEQKLPATGTRAFTAFSGKREKLVFDSFPGIYQGDVKGFR